jgi:hypothetical protein
VSRDRARRNGSHRQRAPRLALESRVPLGDVRRLAGEDCSFRRRDSPDLWKEDAARKSTREYFGSAARFAGPAGARERSNAQRVALFGQNPFREATSVFGNQAQRAREVSSGIGGVRAPQQVELGPVRGLRQCRPARTRRAGPDVGGLRGLARRVLGRRSWTRRRRRSRWRSIRRRRRRRWRDRARRRRQCWRWRLGWHGTPRPGRGERDACARHANHERGRGRNRSQRPAVRRKIERIQSRSRGARRRPSASEDPRPHVSRHGAHAFPTLQQRLDVDVTFGLAHLRLPDLSSRRIALASSRRPL